MPSNDQPAAQTPYDAEWLEYDDDTRPAPSAAPRRRWWQLLWSPSYVRERIAALDDEKLVGLRESIYRNPRGIKGFHLRMVTDECERRGL